MVLRDDDVRYVPKSADIASAASFYLAQGDLLFTRYSGNPEYVGACARVRHHLPNTLYPDKLIRARVIPGLVDPGYLEAVINAPQTREVIRHLVKTTAGQVGISGASLRSIPIPLAPYAEQLRITAIIEEQFSRLDAGNKDLRDARTQLQRLRAAVLGRLLQGATGEEWPTVALAEILVKGHYGTSAKCTYNGPGLPVLRIPNVQSGTISFEDMKNAVDPSVDLSGTLAAEGDVLIIRTNGSRSLIGRAAVVPALGKPVAFASYLIQLKVNRKLIDPAFLVAALGAPRLRSDLELCAATTAGQYNISLPKLGPLRIPLPPLEAQQELMRRVDLQLTGIGHLERDLEQTASFSGRLRSAILSAAFSGNLTSGVSV